MKKLGDQWDPAKNVWELYNLADDFSQAKDLAESNPAKTEAMKQLFMEQAKENKVFSIGGSLWNQLHPKDRISTPYTSWEFDASTRRMPEFTAPGLGRMSSTVEITAEFPENASGVLYALGGFSGGVSLFMDEGRIGFEYNTMMIERSSTLSQKRIAPGEHRVVVRTTIAKPGAPADIVIEVDGEEFAQVHAERTVPLAFTASESFDVGIDLGSPVSPHYYDRRPFEFNGKIDSFVVELE